MKLSRRLETIASFVPEGSTVADIGTDHGYIPIHLVQEGKAKHAIAMDVRKGPLLRAQAHIHEAGLEAHVEVRLSDGLLKLEQNEADCVVIAGMGGELIIHILEEGRGLWEGISHWVLSPHSELDKVRRFLEEQEFFIERETMIKEEGKFYTVMGINRTNKAGEKDNREISYRYGRSLLESKDPVLKEYLKKEEEQLEQIMRGLSESQTEAAVRRIEELKLELAYNKEAQNAVR
ncbi:SAM-dependent methyltransferase [Clostridium sp. WB02_MRS01]|uniref:tRNA (adenine(22)-N(1))-methyltransferase n=1 Tax=Clostridium sp. WB02_MRS01 TaxID=2605777 RepID=UPI0012B2AC5A|nr:class I SAM-dependent methyltransferase [Clostridium sp. WB02_MRS01]MSS07515.1 SAM-dependent methyltransferase [Clostridium sp. WB02_MRS01]